MDSIKPTPRILETQKNKPLSRELLCSAIESILFISEGFQSLEFLKSAFKDYKVSTEDIKTAIATLHREYEQTERGIQIVEMKNSYQLKTKSQNKEFILNSIKPKPFRLSKSALEVLTIVAYKQPCIKAEVDSIRGVESGHLMRTLMERQLVRFAGKSDLPGKPMLYSTTDKFLETFGLKSVKELPDMKEIETLVPEHTGEPPTAIEKLTQSLSENVTTDVHDQKELDHLSQRLSGIQVTSEVLKEGSPQQEDRTQRDSLQEAQKVGAPGKEAD